MAGAGSRPCRSARVASAEASHHGAENEDDFTALLKIVLQGNLGPSILDQAQPESEFASLLQRDDQGLAFVVLGDGSVGFFDVRSHGGSRARHLISDNVRFRRGGESRGDVQDSSRELEGTQADVERLSVRAWQK